MLTNPDTANAPGPGEATYSSDGATAMATDAALGIGAGAVGGKLLGKLFSKPKCPRVRHHTSPAGKNGIKKDGAINPSRAEQGTGVHVEVEPFGLAKKAPDQTGAFGKGSYVEFDAPSNIIKTNVGPRNTGVIPTNKPLSIDKLNPKYH